MNLNTAKIRAYCSCLLISICIGTGWTQTKDSNAIEGSILLDSIWNPVIYLSHIPTFKDMFTMSNEMIVAEAAVDEDGNFRFPSEYFPTEDQLYRLHVSKLESPAASLIIGGPEENHFFLIANGTSTVRITDNDTTLPFGKMSITGNRPSVEIQEIDRLADYMDSTRFEGSIIKGEFFQKGIEDKLRQVADSSSHPLVSLYAVYQSRFESNYPQNTGYYEQYLKKWEDESSQYFQSFRTHFPRQSSNQYLYWLIAAVFFGFGYILHKLLSNRRQQINHDQLKSLTVQERKIFDLIKEGKSNKDISAACNIGLSTVKSHVSSIYAKLGIGSRIEAMDY